MEFRLSFLGAALTAALLTGGVQAQTTLKMDGVWRGSIGAGASIISGNSRSSAFNANAEAIRWTKDDKTRFYATGLYGKNNGVQSVNLIRGGGRYDYDLTPRVFGFGSVDMERDKIGNLKFRVAPALGLGYHLVKNEINTFDVFAGVGYVHDEYYTARNIAGTTRSKYGRPELLIGEQSTHKITDSTSFRQSFVVYPNLDDRGEYRSVFDAGLAVAMSSKVSLTMGLINRYNSDPGAGVKKSDTFFVTGIAAKIE